MDDTAFCTRCKLDKPRRFFSPSQIRDNGHGWCRSCHNEVRNEVRSGQRKVVKQFTVCQLPGCKADISHRGHNAKWCSAYCANRAWHIAHPGAQRKFTIKSLYGLSIDQFDRLLVEQHGNCGICTNDPNTAGGPQQNWNVDHCHRTGNVRGLLCSTCNSGIGQFKDDPELVRVALAYLEKHLTDPIRLPDTVDCAPAVNIPAVETRYCSRCDRHLIQEFFAPSVWAKSKKKAWCTSCYTRDTHVRRGVVDPLPTSSPRTCEAPGCVVDISHMRAHARWCSKACTAAGWRHENPGGRREYWVKTLYGLTTSQADWLLDSQDGSCAICRTTESKQWNIDHCHDSGAVRGVLCSACNLGLGFLGDDPALLRRAITYLEDPPAKRIQLVR